MKFFPFILCSFSLLFVSFDSYDKNEQMEKFDLIAAGKIQPTISAITDSEWERVSPYLLPDDHPIKTSLDAIFCRSRVCSTAATVKQAGFKIIGKGKFSKTIVAKHKDLKGYIIKIIPDNEQSYDLDKLMNRITGAGIIRYIIAKYGYEHWMKVPNKWIYVLPSTPTSSKPYPKHFILVAEDMEILPKKRNYAKWSGEGISAEKLNAIFVLFREGGFHDMIYPFNMPFAKDGRIAFIDTEQYWGIVPYNKLVRYLSPEMATHWQMLIQRDGPW